MKKILIPAFAIIAFAACQKTTKVTPVTTTASATSSTTTNDLSHSARMAYKVFSRVLGSYSCNGKGGNCTETVIVIGSIITGNPTGDGTVFSKLIDATRIGDNAGIINLFNANRDLLLNYMSIDTYTNVVNKTSVVTSVVNDDKISNFVLFNDASSNETTFVLPITLN
jgi:hypothetical protein